MARRRSFAPSSLTLVSATVPLVRGAPKFTLPSPPSTQVIHLAERPRLKRFDSQTKLKDLPRLEFPIGVYGFSPTGPTTKITRPDLTSSISERQLQVQPKGLHP